MIVRVSQKTTSFSDHFGSGGSWLPTMVQNFMDFFGTFWNQKIVENCHLKRQCQDLPPILWESIITERKQAATEWTPDCLQKWYNFDQNCLSKLLQLTMKPELHTGIFGIRDHSIIQQWLPCDLLECFRFTLKSTQNNALMISPKFDGHISTFEWDMAKNRQKSSSWIIQ